MSTVSTTQQKSELGLKTPERAPRVFFEPPVVRPKKVRIIQFDANSSETIVKNNPGESIFMEIKYGDMKGKSLFELFEQLKVE